jgi:plasmid stability protein
MSTEKSQGPNPLFCCRLEVEIATWVRVRAARNGRLVARELEIILREAREREERKPARQ